VVAEFGARMMPARPGFWMHNLREYINNILVFYLPGGKRL